MSGQELVWLADDTPGIRRTRRRNGFSYQSPDGKTISARSETFLRIRALVIPPAWTDVWISPKPDSHLQATGKDARGRKQYRYHDDWRNLRERTKFQHLPLFAKTLPRIRARIRRDLKSPGMTRTKVLATVASLLDKTLIRIGNMEYARENGSYGLTTLRNRHVAVHRSSISFTFRGKSGKSHSIQLDDPRLARIVRRCQELPGQHLFEYLDEEQTVCPIGSRDVNEYVQAIAGVHFSAKDFRTWHATAIAVSDLAGLPPASTIGEAKQNCVDIVKHVAQALGNTPAVCRKSYIHPIVLQACLDRLAVPDPVEKPKGLTVPERQTLALLRKLKYPENA